MPTPLSPILFFFLLLFCCIPLSYSSPIPHETPSGITGTPHVGLMPISKENIDFSQWTSVLDKLLLPHRTPPPLFPHFQPFPPSFIILSLLLIITEISDGVTYTVFNYSGLLHNQHFINFSFQIFAADLTDFTQDEVSLFSFPLLICYFVSILI